MHQTKNTDVTLDDEQQVAFNEILNNPGQSFFIQGQAGTGKSTLINHIRKHLGREVAVVAPTGIAAELIGGSTIHRMFNLGGRPYFPKCEVEQYKNYEEVVSVIQTLIIDEASMLRADVFDTIDTLCKKAKNKKDVVFGGIQIVLVGDLYQLPPVYKSEDAEALEYMQKTYHVWEPFFFDADCYEAGKFKMLKLTKGHRQNADEQFFDDLKNITMLNTPGNSAEVNESLARLNKHFEKKADTSGMPVVTSTNAQAQNINNDRLKEIPAKEKIYQGVFYGEYYDLENENQQTLENRKKSVVVPAELRLKEGAKVMFCRNDAKGGKYVNGTMGVVAELTDDSIKVKVNNGDQVEVFREKWYVQEYVKSDQANGALVLNTIGTYEQYPLKLAYAITIHKSQGQTWDNVCIDLGDHGAFASGQTYVALSRVKTQEGVHLLQELNREDIKVNPRIQEFLTTGNKPKPCNDVPRGRGARVMVAFWRSLFPDANEVHYANCSRRRVNNRCLQCFWYTLDRVLLKEDFYLIALQGNKSWFFKIPAGSCKDGSFAVNRHITSQDGRHEMNDREFEAFSKKRFDIFMENTKLFKERFLNLVDFQQYLVAKEINGKVTLCRDTDETNMN